MLSRPVSTVAPVVLRPDIVSKNASVNVRPGRAISSGTVAIADMNTHAERDQQEAVTRTQFALVLARRRHEPARAARQPRCAA